MSRFRVTAGEALTEIVFDDEGMNLLSSAALRELRDVVDSIDASTAVLLFRSGRPSLFAAGADMAEMRQLNAWEAWEFSRLGQETFDTIERLPCITVAWVDGDCFGGALDLILAFDLRVASARSRFAHPGAKLGIVTGFGGTTRWRRLLDRNAANQVFLANRIVSAGKALQLGVVDQVNETVDEVVERLSSIDRETAGMIKEIARAAPRLSRSELLLLADRLGHVYFGPRGRRRT